MARKDHYQVLGIDRGASPDEIKRAYRKLARRYHPDVTGDDPRATERFKELTDAYEVLSDPKRRRTYDFFGDEHHPGFGNPFSTFKNAVGDIFKRPDREPTPGVDLEVPLVVRFQEAFEGAKKTIEVKIDRPCGDCEGAGHPKGAAPKACPDCDGSGKVKTAFGISRSCTRCDGTGSTVTERCKKCGGKGVRKIEEKLLVTVPAGVDDGARLRLKGRGPAGLYGGPPGDLYARVDVDEDHRFVRVDDDIRTRVRVGLKQALLGDSISVPLPVGSATMKIPAGTQGGQVFRLRGKGFPSLSGDSRGDLLVTVQLRVPKDLDENAQKLVQELDETVDGL